MPEVAAEKLLNESLTATGLLRTWKGPKTRVSFSRSKHQIPRSSVLEMKLLGRFLPTSFPLLANLMS